MALNQKEEMILVGIYFINNSRVDYIFFNVGFARSEESACPEKRRRRGDANGGETWLVLRPPNDSIKRLPCTSPLGDRIAIELAKVGVPVSHNPLMWSECSNFIDYNMNAVNPKSIENPSSDGDCWDNNAAFACLDKFLFRENMLYAACVVGDLTIAELEGRLEQFVMDDVLAEPPSELRFTKPAEHCPRIPIDLSAAICRSRERLEDTDDGAASVESVESFQPMR